MSETKIPQCVLVIFGGTGDLTHRKLMPALYNLKYQHWLPENFAVVAVGRSVKTNDVYRHEILESVTKYSRFEVDEILWEEFSGHVFYKNVDFVKGEGIDSLDTFLKTVDEEQGTKGNRIFYLAVAPEHFAGIIECLYENRMTPNDDLTWQRIVIEKPFGSSLESARRLNLKISQIFNERNTFRIDHYLGKELVQSILDLRFSNVFFGALWNHQYIDNIQISACETIGIENRGEYYEKVGATGDMLQNHLLQILALVAMEPPLDNSSESVRDEKLRLLNSIENFTKDTVASDIVFGQYTKGEIDKKGVLGYGEENKVSGTSETETFLALKIEVKNARWPKVPFYIRTGKRLEARTTNIVVQFKSTRDGMEPNLLMIKIQPNEEILLQFNTKNPGIKGGISPVKMTYCQKCKACAAEINSPEAYEKLICDVFMGDSTLFTRWDEVEKSWEFIENIKVLKRKEKKSLTKYAAGSWGPKQGDELLERDGRHWWNV
jgi:glucose-6-phosphate 1-dehydrogenase